MVLTTLQVCRQCKFFRPDKDYMTKEFRIFHGRCRHDHATVMVDIAAGIERHMFARHVRSGDIKYAPPHPLYMCGPEAVHFQQEHNHLTIFIREHISVYLWLQVMVSILCVISAMR